MTTLTPRDGEVDQKNELRATLFAILGIEEQGPRHVVESWPHVSPFQVLDACTAIYDFLTERSDSKEREKAIRECIAVLTEYRYKHSLALEIIKVDDCIAEIENLLKDPYKKEGA